MAFQLKEAVEIKKKEFWIRYIMAGIQLPIKLNNYINIFNKKSTGELLFNHPKDHIIKINNKDPLYGPLYNLFIRKLEVLCQYLNKILKKGWIKPFTSPIRTPILFIPKKDRSLWLYINY